MYNGVGLTTPRGSATNGFIQRNLAFVRPKDSFIDQKFEITAPKPKKANKEILEHQRKRAIELKVVEWAEANNIFNLDDETAIQKALAEKREELTKLQEAGHFESSDKYVKNIYQLFPSRY